MLVANYFQSPEQANPPRRGVHYLANRNRPHANRWAASCARMRGFRRSLQVTEAKANASFRRESYFARNSTGHGMANALARPSRGKRLSITAHICTGSPNRIALGVCSGD